MGNPECPYCEDEIDINTDEPGEWCHNDNIPDGSWNVVCENCKNDVVIVSDWTPRFDAIKTEDY